MEQRIHQSGTMSSLLEKGTSQKELLRGLGGASPQSLMCFHTDIMLRVDANLTLTHPLCIVPRKGRGIEKVEVMQTC